MLLKKVTIYKYKSFMQEQSYTVEEQITRIVGKNESGKTALLEALAKTNYFEDNKDFVFNKELDYPRSELTKIRKSNPEAITCEYELNDEDLKSIRDDFCEGIISKQSFSITTHYENNSTVSGIDVNFDIFKTWLISKLNPEEADKELIRGTDNFSELLEVTHEFTQKQELAEIRKILTQINQYSGDWNDPLAGYIYSNYISPKIPKFWYFSDYFSLPYRINLNSFAQKVRNKNISTEEDKITNALFELSDLQVSDVLSEANYEFFRAQLEATSNRITDEMFQYWTTNQNLEIRFEIEHLENVRHLNIRIYNQKHRVTLPLKNRSKGFLWFFSFLVWFSKIQGDKDSQYILLLDEPGLSLHASAQNDLLRFIEEKLAPEYQVIYTTHSPFMIDPLKLNEVRTVYDTRNANTGSIVSDALEERDSDTLFPLQAALGYTIAQNLYISSKNLLVEGISDLVYISHFSSILKDLGREGLLEDVTIVPVGGADKIATFISLMRGNQLDSVCLLDTFTDQKAQSRLKRLTEEKIIESQNILHYHSVTGSTFADIEDLFDKEEYLSLYNGAFDKTIKITDIDLEKPILSQLKRLNSNKPFNHYSPANYMARNIGKFNFSNETLNRFEKLFAMVNKKFL